ncbi:COG1361 S-layer family protein [Candidatus Pyrohabitans sp.]
MRLYYLVVLAVMLLAIPSIHSERVGIEVVGVQWGDNRGIEAYPGDENIPLIIKINNPSSYDMGTIKFTLKFSKPLYFEYLENGARVRKTSYETVLAGIKANATATLRFNLNIDERASPGIYRAELKAVYVDDPIKRDIFPIYVTVSGISKLVIENFTTAPLTPLPGDVLNAEVNIKNSGSRKLSDIEARLTLSMPFLPEGLGYYRYISSLAPGRETRLKFQIRVAGDAQPGSYAMPVVLEYRQAGGHRVKENYTLGINVATPANFEITSISLNPSSGYTDGTPQVPCCRDVELEFDVINIARVDAGFVEVEIPEGDGYVVNPKSTYVGTLSSDDFSTVRFRLRFKEGSSVAKIPVNIRYTDESNKRGIVKKVILLSVGNNPQSKPEGELNNPGLISRFLRWLLGI